MRVNTVFFDLDGTLWPPQSVILPAYCRVFERLGIACPSEAELLDTLGYPNQEIWARLLPDQSDELGPKANQLMADAELELLAEGVGQPFPDVVATLKTLSDAGMTLAILSNCDVSYLQAVPDALGIGAYFQHRFCAGGYPGLTKAQILAKILHQFRLPAAMVGDRFHDMEAGRDNGLITIGCRFGFGKTEELASADHTIDRFAELTSILLRD